MANTLSARRPAPSPPEARRVGGGVLGYAGAWRSSLLGVLAQCAIIAANCIGTYFLGGLWQFNSIAVSFAHTCLAFSDKTATCLAAVHHVFVGVCALTGLRFSIDTDTLLR